MMKKVLVVLLSAMMVMSLVACGGDDTTVEDQQVENEVVDDSVVEDDVAAETGVVVLDETAGDGMPIVYASFGDVDLFELDAYGYSDPADMEGLTWLMAGGRDANVEQSAEDHIANMQGLNGIGGFQFEADGYAVLLLGMNAEGIVNTFEGSYEIDESGAIIVNFDMQGTGYPETYFCTIVDGGNGTPVLLAYSDEALENCIYMVNMAAE